MDPEKVRQNVDRMAEHIDQVLSGQIPEDAPAGFVKPVGDDAVDDRGLPWWFGSRWKLGPDGGPGVSSPTPEAQEELDLSD